MCEHAQEFILALCIVVLCIAEAVSSCLKASDSLLESLLVGLTDTHDLTYGTHLCSKLVLDTLELLKCPACKLDNHVVTVRNVFVQCAVLTALNILEGKSCCQHG